MKPTSSTLRSSFRCAALTLLVLAGLTAGCNDSIYAPTDYGSTDNTFSYGAGVYDPWGYYGNPYYGYGRGGTVIIATPPRPVQPIARPRPY